MTMANENVSLNNELLSVRDWIRWAASEFQRAELHFGHGTDNAWDEAVQLVLWSIACPWQRLPEIADARLTGQEKDTLRLLIGRRIAERLPLPYITGRAFFAGLEFEVSKDTLIPRSPIGELIANEFSPWLPAEPGRILDLCTGSGCIGIACADVFPDAEVHLSDISLAALAVAERNIQKHNLLEQVIAIQSDLFENLPGCYDLIVSNPPYVDAEDMAALPAEFHAEPSLALASGDDGLEFTRRLLREAADHLNPGGTLIVEVGNSFAALEQSMPDLPFTWVELENGGHGVFVLSREQLVQHRASFA